MQAIDNTYDTAMRNTVGNDVYDCDSANLHLLGMGMDNVAADRAEDEIKARQYRDDSRQVFGFVL
jgi:hypothetical protein